MLHISDDISQHPEVDVVVRRSVIGIVSPFPRLQRRELAVDDCHRLRHEYLHDNSHLSSMPPFVLESIESRSSGFMFILTPY